MEFSQGNNSFKLRMRLLREKKKNLRENVNPVKYVNHVIFFLFS